MSDIKTKPTAVSPNTFIDTVEGEQRRKDCRELVSMMKKITGKPAIMWGPAIIGFGKYHYKYESGREGEMMVAGFSPRKTSLTLYIGSVLENKKLMARLGKHKTTGGCLHIKTLDDIDRDVLKGVITESVEENRKRYVCE